MTLPSPAEVEHAAWSELKAFASTLGLNPRGRSGLVRQRVLDHLRGRGPPAEWRAGKGEQASLLTRIGFAEAAADLWESTISLDAPAPWVGMGIAYARSGRTDEAVKCFDRAVAMGDAGARLPKAHVLAAAGRTDLALSVVDEALASRPDDVRALAMRAGIAASAGLSEDAEAAHRRLGELGRGRVGLARILMRAGGFEEAERALAAHLEGNPKDGVAWNNRGACLGKLGRWKDAVDAFRKANALRPRDPGPLLNLSIALAAIGKDDEALRRIESARRISEDPKVLFTQTALVDRRAAPAPARETPRKPARAATPTRRKAPAKTARARPRSPQGRSKPQAAGRGKQPPKPAGPAPVKKSRRRKPTARKPAARKSPRGRTA